MKAYLRSIVIILVLAVLPLSIAEAAKKARKIVGISGKISALKHGRDRKHKSFWEYKVKAADGHTVIVHDYKVGKARQPASAGIVEGKKINSTGFFVNIRLQKGSEDRTDVFIIPEN